MNASRVRADVSRIREATLIAIRNRNEGLVEESLEVYRQLVVAFIRRLRRYGTTFDRRQSIREASAWPLQGWPEIEWIVDDYRAILEEAFQFQHKGILGDVLYFPTSIASAALNEGDYFTFYRVALEFPKYAYTLSSRLPATLERDFAQDRIGRHLAEFMRFHVGSRLDRPSSIDEVARIGEMCEGVMVAFTDLLKASFDNRDLPSFERFLAAMNSSVNRLGSQLPGFEIWRSGRGMLGASALPQGRVDLYRALSDTLDRVREVKDIGRLGINSWITRQYNSDLLDAPAFTRWFTACGNFGSFADLTSVFTAAQSLSTQDKMRWNWWLMDGVEDRVVTIDFDGSLALAYLLHALNVIGADDSDPSKIGDQVQPSREFTYLCDRPEAPLRVLLRELPPAASRWAPVVIVPIAPAAARVGAVLDRIVLRQQEQWAERVVESPLELSRVQRFKDDILAGYARTSELRKFFATLGRLRQEEAESRDGWGYNTLLPKDIFVADSNVVVGGFGREYGTGVARGLEERALQSLLEGIGEPKGLSIGEDAIDAMCVFGNALRERGLKPTILLLGSWRTSARLYADPRFAAESQEEGYSTSGRIGALEKMDVYQMHWRQGQEAVIGDFDKLGIWTQVTPRIAPERKEERLGTDLLFMLEAVTEDEARSLIERQSDFLVNPQTQLKEEPTTAIRRLQGRAHFRLFANGKFVVEDGTAGIRLRLREELPGP